MLSVIPDESGVAARLLQLGSQFSWPAGWSLAEPFTQRQTVDRLTLGSVGLVAHGPEGASAIGAAAEPNGFPVDRAFFELTERLSIVEARARADALVLRDPQGRRLGSIEPARVFSPGLRPERIRTSLSNGTALHQTWPQACAAAVCELIERDRVLRSFAGEFPPIRIALGDRPLAAALDRAYALEAYRFAPSRSRRRLRHSVAGVFMFPRDRGAPFVCGFGAARGQAAALAAAAREALQRLAFLWGEALPTAAPPPAPLPDFHQEHYLYPPHQALLRRWLAGRWPGRRRVRDPGLFDGAGASFIDLTPAALSGRLAVVRASARRARPLVFGQANPHPATPPHPIC